MGGGGGRLMLVSEVALGLCQAVTDPQPGLTRPPEPYDSVQGVAASPEQKSFFKV